MKIMKKGVELLGWAKFHKRRKGAVEGSIPELTKIGDSGA